MDSIPNGEAACCACGAQGSEARCRQCGAARRAGCFHIEQLCSQTPHGRTYLARDAAGQRVALKEVGVATALDRAQLDGLEGEAKLVAQLHHAGIPPFVDYFWEGEGPELRLYRAQQHVEGRSLDQELAAGLFSEATLLEVAQQTLEILHYLQSQSPLVVHRDLKPSNLVRRASDGSVILVDLGSARGVRAGGTMGATLRGTFGYMPQEQLGGTVDATTDLYSLGATLVHLATGRPPDELVEARTLRLAFEPHVRHLSPKARAFLRKLTAPRREMRFASAAEALLALESPAGDGSTSAAIPWRWIGVGSAVVLGLALAGYAWRGRTPAAPAEATASLTVPVAPPMNLDPFATDAPAPAARLAPPTTAVAPPSPVPALPSASPTIAPPRADVPSTAQPTAEVNAKLRAYWPLDEEKGGTATEVTGRFPGTSAPLAQPGGVFGRAGGALILPIEAFADLPQGALSFWMKRMPPSQSGAVIGQMGRGATLYVGDFWARFLEDGRLGFSAPSKTSQLVTLEVPEKIAAGEFHHFVLNWHPGSRRLFLDGKLVASDDVAPTFSTDSRGVVFGGQSERADQSLRWASLWFDDVRLYASELSNPDVWALWTDGSNVPGVAGARLPRRVAFEGWADGQAWSLPRDAHMLTDAHAGDRKDEVVLSRTDAPADRTDVALYTMHPRIPITVGARVWLEYDVWVGANTRRNNSGVTDPNAAACIGIQSANPDDYHGAKVWVCHNEQDEDPRGLNAGTMVLVHRKSELGKWSRGNRVELNSVLRDRDIDPIGRIWTIELRASGIRFEDRFANIRIVEE